MENNTIQAGQSRTCAAPPLFSSKIAVFGKEINAIWPILIIYISSRLLLFKIGVRFELLDIPTAWQYLDIEILKNHLLRGVFFQHSQPPLFNLFIGSVLKAFPQNYHNVFAIIYYCFSLTSYFLIYRILTLIGINNRFAFLFSSIFILSPEAILYENWLFYTWAVTTLLTLSAYWLLLYDKYRNPKHAALFLATISIICLTRSMFHIVYLLAGAALVIIIPSDHQKKVIKYSVISILFVGSLYLKNYVLFGVFGSSSWMGMNLWKVAYSPKIEVFNAPGYIPPFSPISKYPKEFRKIPESYQNLPELSSPQKTNGAPNFNNYGYIPVSKKYLSASIKSILNDPAHYLNNMYAGLVTYSCPSWEYGFVRKNKDKLKAYIDAINTISMKNTRMHIEKNILGIDKLLGVDKYKLNLPPTSLLVIPLSIFLITINLLIKLKNYYKTRQSPTEFYLFAFMAITVLYVTIIGNCFEFFENNRFRVQSDTLLYMALIVTVREIWRKYRERSHKSISA